MTARALAPGLYGYDALETGDVVETGSVTVTAARIDAFAELTGDRFDIHMDRAAARQLGFADRVAHGLLVLSLVDGLKNAAPAQFRAVASLGWTWRFSAPVLVGDSVRAVIGIAARRLTGNTERGILTLDVTVRNQRDEIVQEGENRLMVLR